MLTFQRPKNFHEFCLDAALVLAVLLTMGLGASSWPKPEAQQIHDLYVANDGEHAAFVHTLAALRVQTDRIVRLQEDLDACYAHHMDQDEIVRVCVDRSIEALGRQRGTALPETTRSLVRTALREEAVVQAELRWLRGELDDCGSAYEAQAWIADVCERTCESP